MSREAYVYMMADRYRGTIYTGVTTAIARRVWQHRSNEGSRFAAAYELHRLVYVEVHEEIAAAIRREKAIKKWRREWKIELIESMNPDWLDLYGTLHM